MLGGRLRRIVDLFRRTPLHPQWLLGDRGPVLARLRALPPGRVLDIGCNDRWVERTLPADSEYIGVDYYATGKLMYGSRPNVFADAAVLPFASESVDAVVILDVIEHLRNPREALKEISRVLKPGGRLILSMPFLYPIHDAPHDYQRYTAHGLVRELGAVDMQLKEVTPNLSAARTAGVIACLALAGMALESLRRRSPSMLLLPAIVLAVPLINLMAWATARLLPDWSAATAGYIAVATRQ